MDWNNLFNLDVNVPCQVNMSWVNLLWTNKRKNYTRRLDSNMKIFGLVNSQLSHFCSLCERWKVLFTVGIWDKINNSSCLNTNRKKFSRSPLALILTSCTECFYRYTFLRVGSKILFDSQFDSTVFLCFDLLAIS